VRDLKKYWRDVRELERSLPPFVWLACIEGAVLTEVRAAEAAKLLLAKSHRMAEPGEIAAYSERQSAAVRQEFHAELRRQGITIVPIPQRGLERKGRSRAKI
jgi:hypothetical protein